jgi:uncharacterized protein DUF6941
MLVGTSAAHLGTNRARYLNCARFDGSAAPAARADGPAPSVRSGRSLTGYASGVPSPLTCELLLLCESASIGPGGRSVFTNLINRLVVPSLPFTSEVICFAAELWGPENADVPVAFGMVGPDGESIYTAPEQVVALGPEGIRSFGGTLDHMTLRSAGRHELLMLVDERVIGRARFLVDVDPEATDWRMP